MKTKSENQQWAGSAETTDACLSAPPAMQSVIRSADHFGGKLMLSKSSSESSESADSLKITEIVKVGTYSGENFASMASDGIENIKRNLARALAKSMVNEIAALMELRTENSYDVNSDKDMIRVIGKLKVLR